MVIYLIILLAILTRFIPHMPNAAPVTALAIFAASYLPKKQAIAIPLAVRFVSDIFLGFFSWPLMLAVYLSHLFGVVLGLWIRKSIKPVVIPSEAEESLSKGRQGISQLRLRFTRDDKITRWLKIGSSGFVAGTLFFLVTNFAFFYKEYAHNWAGIMLAYTNGLPFLRGTIIGDVGYTVALFAAYELAKRFSQNFTRRKQESF